MSTFVVGTALLISVVAFIIPKFIAIWSIPQMVVASSTVSANAAVAEQLLAPGEFTFLVLKVRSGEFYLSPEYHIIRFKE